MLTIFFIFMVLIKSLKTKNYKEKKMEYSNIPHVFLGGGGKFQILKK